MLTKQLTLPFKCDNSEQKSTTIVELLKDTILCEQFLQSFENYLAIKGIRLSTDNDNSNTTNISIRELVQIAINEYQDFAIDENFFECNQKMQSISNLDLMVHKILLYLAQFIYELFFTSLKVKRDENTFDTPSRVAKMFIPPITDYKEPMSGRWTIEPTLTKFTCENSNDSLHCSAIANDTTSLQVLSSKVDDNLICIELNIYGMCSHHMMPFSTFNESKIKVAYIPGMYIPGLSKIGRYIEFISRRGWLQESLVRTICEKLMESFSLAGVYVLLDNIIHTCSVHRGYADDTKMTSEYYTGIFKTDKSVLDRARNIAIRNTYKR